MLINVITSWRHAVQNWACSSCCSRSLRTAAHHLEWALPKAIGLDTLVRHALGQGAVVQHCGLVSCPRPPPCRTLVHPIEPGRHALDQWVGHWAGRSNRPI
eukprot:1396834-Amphidinium_carterae.1